MKIKFGINKWIHFRWVHYPISYEWSNYPDRRWWQFEGPIVQIRFDDWGIYWRASWFHGFQFDHGSVTS